MNKLTCLSLFWLAFIINPIFPQSTALDNSKLVSKTYDRCALTMLWNNYRSDAYGSMKDVSFEKALKISDKYDDNSLNSIKLSQNYEANNIEFGRNSANQIKTIIEDNHIASSVIAFWFNQQVDGSFKMDRIADRGQYNATIGDINEAMMTKRGLAMVKDAGLNLVDKSYILVFDVEDIKTMKEIAKANGNKSSDGQNTYLSNSSNPAKKNGFRADIKLYLYKIEFNDSIAALFYNNYWVNESDGVQTKSKRKAALATFNIPVTLIDVYSTQVTEAQIKPGLAGAPSVQKTKNDMFSDMILSGVNSNLEKMERNYSGFAVKSRLKTVKPKITANIGRKEGLYIDQRYFVYEDVQRSSGKVVSVRRGVIRAKKVANNKSMASTSTKPSEFYQVAGRRLNEYSMFIAQKNDIGFGLSLGYSSGAFTGPMFRLEYNLSKGIDQTSRSNIKPGLFLFGDIGFQSMKYSGAGNYFKSPPSDNEYSFTYMAVGLEKQLYFARHFQLTPYVSYQYEAASWDDGGDEDPSIGAHGIALGASFGMNVTHNVQLYYRANVHAPLALVDENKLIQDAEAVYTDVFIGDDNEKRSGLSNTLQLRILF